MVCAGSWHCHRFSPSHRDATLPLTRKRRKNTFDCFLFGVCVCVRACVLCVHCLARSANATNEWRTWTTKLISYDLLFRTVSRCCSHAVNGNFTPTTIIDVVFDVGTIVVVVVVDVVFVGISMQAEWSLIAVNIISKSFVTISESAWKGRRWCAMSVVSLVYFSIHHRRHRRHFDYYCYYWPYCHCGNNKTKR